MRYTSHIKLLRDIRVEVECVAHHAKGSTELKWRSGATPSIVSRARSNFRQRFLTIRAGSDLIRLSRKEHFQAELQGGS